MVGTDDAIDPDRTTVLVAEDDGAFRAFLGAQLMKRGYRVILAHHGGELLACAADFALRASPFIDAVVTDSVMPTATGDDALRALRRLGSHVPVIVMSAFLDPDRMRELRAEGANATLAKPFALSELLALLPPPRRSQASTPAPEAWTLAEPGRT